MVLQERFKRMRSYFYLRLSMLPNDEYLEIKDFLRHRVCEINRSENIDREKQREKKTKYSLPIADSFGWMPAITLCMAPNHRDEVACAHL